MSKTLAYARIFPPLRSANGSHRPVPAESSDAMGTSFDGTEAGFIEMIERIPMVASPIDG